MQYVDGPNLRMVVHRRGPLPPATAVHYALQAARGLDYAHRRGVIHRDVKPSNLLLDRDGVVKVLDMGLARFHASDDGQAPRTELTSEGMAMGTVDFMVPEQADDPRHVDARADIYSLGCTLWYLLTASRMYDAPTALQTLLAHRSSPIPSLTDCRPDAPVQLQSLFARLVAKDPQDRPQSMAEVIAELEALLPLLPEPPSDERAPSEENHSTVAISLEEQSPASPPETIVLSERDTAEEPSNSPQPQPAPQKRRRRLAPMLVVALGVVGVIATAQIIIRIKNKDGSQTEIAIPNSKAVDSIEIAANGSATPQIRIAADKIPSKLETPASHPAAGGPNQTEVAGNAAEANSPNPPVWKAGVSDDLEKLPGLIPEPKSIPGVHRWQVTTQAPAGEMAAMAWSPDSRYLACALGDCTVRVYHMPSGQLIRIFSGHSEDPFAVTWSRDGREIASCGWDQTIRVWSLADATCRLTLTGHTGLVGSVAWSPNGELLASAGRHDETARI